MNDASRFELRIASLLDAYADRAPTGVNPDAMTRLAAGQDRSRTLVFGVSGADLRFVLLLLALLAALVGGTMAVGGRLFLRDPADVLTERGFTEPFLGLPPEGTAPSTPEIGELVLSFYGRVHSLGLDFHRMWLYADGRLIWKSNLEGTSAGQAQRFGASEPTTAIIEQRLTPEGIELIRSRVMAAGLTDVDVGTNETAGGGPGVLWGRLVVQDGEGLVQAAWSDPAMPGLLADLASWLPAAAWEDQRIGGYVPSRFAVCVNPAAAEGVPGIAPSEMWDLVPETARALIRSKAIDGPVPNWSEQDPRCLYEVSTDDVRAIDAGLEDAGLRRTSQTVLHYVGIEVPSIAGVGSLQILAVTPNGEVVCDCG